MALLSPFQSSEKILAEKQMLDILFLQPSCFLSTVSTAWIPSAEMEQILPMDPPFYTAATLTFRVPGISSICNIGATLVAHALEETRASGKPSSPLAQV